MQVPLRITFHDMPPSEFIENRIREKADKLARFSERIIDCHVTVEMPHRHHHKGVVYRVNVDLRLPKGEIVANRSPDADHSHEDVYVAIRDAFDAATRQLESLVQKQRDHGK
jgi:ribosomal subunit interface protein